MNCTQYVSPWPLPATAWFTAGGQLRGVGDPVDRILARVDASGDCWEWMGGRSSDGYGSTRVVLNGQRVTNGVHLILYEALVGPRPEGTEFDHLCKNKVCVNPDHLQPVPHGENVRRGASGWALKTGQATAQQKRDVCVAGLHDLNDPANARNRADGGRQCRPCLAGTMRAWRAANPRAKKSDAPDYVHGNTGRTRTHCPKGHAYTEHGGVTKSGHNFCRTCKNNNWNASYHARRARNLENAR